MERDGVYSQQYQNQYRNRIHTILIHLKARYIPYWQTHTKHGQAVFQQASVISKHKTDIFLSCCIDKYDQLYYLCFMR